MINFLLKTVKKIIIAIFMLYGLNLAISSLNFMIPINLITIILVSLLGIPGICSLVVLCLII